MKIKSGQNIIVRDRRKGTFKATAIADFDTEEDYDEAMTGGEMDDSYLFYGGDV